jgi:hypothetical protein
MSRAIIGGIVATVIVVLTATAYFVTTARLSERIESDVRDRVSKAQGLLVQNATLEGLGMLKRVEVLASNPLLVRALESDNRTSQASLAHRAFDEFIEELGQDEPRPDIIGIIDAAGDLVALLDVPNPLARAWRSGDGYKYPALAAALEHRQIVSEVWHYENIGLMKVGVAPIVDPETDRVEGAIAIAFAMTALEAQRLSRLLGADVAWFYGERVFATSFRRGAAGEEDTAKQTALREPLTGLGPEALARGVASSLVRVELDGKTYFATAGHVPRFASSPLPDGYPPPAAGAMVLMSLSDAKAPLSTIRMAILSLGLGALVVAMLAIGLTSRRIMTQADQIELGITEIINGNLDRTFRPVGSELDGLAHSINVMLARLLGRPEPGEEEYDEDGNLIQRGTLEVDTENLSPADEAAVALAQEPEPDYYKRLYTEYTAAREQSGQGADGASFESFVAKLRLSEASLKQKYECRAVRFRVVVAGGKVTLKPVPIV